MHITELPFARLNCGQLESLWAPKPTGDYAKDCDTGATYAAQWRDYMTAGGSPGSLVQIVNAMPAEKSGVEIGFLSAVAGRVAT